MKKDKQHQWISGINASLRTSTAIIVRAWAISSGVATISTYRTTISERGPRTCHVAQKIRTTLTISGSIP